MKVQKKIYNPVLEAVQYHEFVKELVETETYGEYRFRNKIVVKGTFCDWYFLKGTNILMEPKTVWVLDEDNNVVHSLGEDDLRQDYWVGIG